jgi:hypothetical protein
MQVKNIPAITETKVVEIQPQKLEVTLTVEEAGTLASILGKVEASEAGLYGHLVKFIGGDDIYEKKYKQLYSGRIMRNC